jgi:hypothetical protein
MKKTLKLIFSQCILLSFASGFGQTLSRQTISPSGIANSQNGISVNQTIGQPYQTNSSATDKITLRPGFQQPVFYAELISSAIQVRVVPNPALLSFYVESSDTLQAALLSVNDGSGRMIFEQKIDLLQRTEIHCETWANGVYFITITDKKKNLITTKLIKHQ